MSSAWSLCNEVGFLKISDIESHFFFPGLPYLILDIMLFNSLSSSFTFLIFFFDKIYYFLLYSTSN